MDGTDHINEAIMASLANFTKKLEEVSNDQFNEMRKCFFFDPIPSEYLTHIASQSKLKTFSTGETIIRAGDKLYSFYVLIFGNANVFVNGKQVGVIRSGECLGEGAFFSGANSNLTRSATVVAEGEVIAAEITKGVVDSMNGEIRSYMDKALLLALFKKLQGANRKLNELMPDK